MYIDKEAERDLKRHIESIESLIIDLKERIDETEDDMNKQLLRETLLENRNFLKKERDDLKDFLWFLQDANEKKKLGKQ